jgi:hypothetical protein
VCEITVCTSILGKELFLIDHLKKDIAFIVHKVKHVLYGHLSENWWRKERMKGKSEGGSFMCRDVENNEAHILCLVDFAPKFCGFGGNNTKGVNFSAYYTVHSLLNLQAVRSSNT